VEGLKEVAVKLHSVASQWGRSKAEAYVRHAMREYRIHRTLQHPHIVAMMDVFEIDALSFATVLELCARDLDTHLKAHQVGAGGLPGWPV
jgi:tousled-like kinase